MTRMVYMSKYFVALILKWMHDIHSPHYKMFTYVHQSIMIAIVKNKRNCFTVLLSIIMLYLEKVISKA